MDELNFRENIRTPKNRFGRVHQGSCFIEGTSEPLVAHAIKNAKAALVQENRIAVARSWGAQQTWTPAKGVQPMELLDAIKTEYDRLRTGLKKT